MPSVGLAFVAAAWVLAVASIASAVPGLATRCEEEGSPASYCQCLERGLRAELGEDDYRLFDRVLRSQTEFRKSGRPGLYVRQLDEHARLAQELGITPTDAPPELAGAPPGQVLIARFETLQARVAHPVRQQCEAAWTAAQPRSADPAEDPSDAALRRRIEADRSPGVDRSVFGLELGRPLELPPCSKEDVSGGASSLFLRIGKGATRTCVGGIDPRGAARAIEAAVGLPRPATGVSRTMVTLADESCPDWLRIGGMCAVEISTKDDLALGAVLITGNGPRYAPKIMRQLTEKYGREPDRGDTVTCENSATGVVTDRATVLHWTLPGLHVTYDPIIGDCNRGQITVELDTLRELRRAAEAAQEASEPRM